MSETFRLHLHDSAVQHMLVSPSHEALRITIVGDSECLVPCGMRLEGSNDQAVWFFLTNVEEGSTNLEIASPFIYLRASGYADGGTSINGSVVVEYLDALTDVLQNVTITDQPIEVTGTVQTAGTVETKTDPTQHVTVVCLLEEIRDLLIAQNEILKEIVE